MSENQTEKVKCCKCQKELERHEVGHQHLWMSFCKPCGKEYKEKNSWKCMICSVPNHSCCC